MSAALSNSTDCREHALNALIEIRACHDELRTFLAETFDRLEEIVGQLRHDQPAAESVDPPAESDMMQNQIDYLTRLVNDLAHSIKTRETPTAEVGARPSKAGS